VTKHSCHIFVTVGDEERRRRGQAGKGSAKSETKQAKK